ncbi:MAG: energy-coupling factor ABC transporter permease [Azoarcus sp.]|jgi:uncharacterized membrane protein|nr:energy-coupling factor ABC transporter permease [Azoarcus sp.]
MNLPASLFGTAWHWVSWALATLVLYQVWLRAPWARLRDSTQLNLLLGVAVTLALAWTMKAGVKPGLNLHLLGAMLAVLCLGARLALVALALSLVGIAASGGIEWQAWAINFLLMAVVPVIVANAIRQWVEKHLPAHFFVFVFVVGFAGSAIVIMLQGALASAALALSGAYEAGYLINEYLPYFLLVGFSEAWLSGALITLFVVYRPEWVVAFDDRRYLLNK